MAFWITFLAQFVKTDDRQLLGLLSEAFHFENLLNHCSVSLYNFQWPDDRPSTNNVSFHFCETEEKVKKKGITLPIRK